MDIKRCEDYLNSLESDLPDYLESIIEYAKLKHIPIVRRSELNVIKSIIKIIKPQRILELGTAIGFSSLYMEYASNNESKITTIENYKPNYDIAMEHFLKYDIHNNINCIFGDAIDIVKNLNDTYDLIFLDFAKGQYITILDDIVRLLNNNGVIITDNIFQDGDLLESSYTINKRDRTIHKRMRQFMKKIYNMSEFTNMTIPLGDGICISYKEV